MHVGFNTSLPVQFEVLNQIEDTRFVKGKIWVCHTGENLNKSTFSKQAIENAISSLANIPVLGFIQVDNENNADFKGHEERIVIDENGARIEYLGRVYGLVPESNNAQFEMKMCDDGVEREFLTTEVLLYTKFPECIDIVQKNGVKNHSMELQPESIKGFINKDKLFEFTDFKFEGLCLLGDSVTPAMRGSVLEVFSKQSTYKNDYFELLKEFNHTFSKINGQSQSNEGGNEKLGEKLQELLEKYSSLTEEDIAKVKENLEKFNSEDELETELIRLSEVKKDDPIQNPEPDNNFSLTAQQFRQEISNILKNEKATNKWGDEIRAYWYIDHDENRVYAEDTQNSYLPVGFNYATSGDKVTIDFSTKKRIKWVPQDLEDGVVDVPTMMSLDRAQDLEQVTEQFATYKSETQEKIATFESDLTTKENEIKQLQEQFSALEKEHAKVNSEYSAKLQAEREEAENKIFSTFSKELTEDEMAEVVANKDKMELEDIENQLFALVGKKKAKFSLSTEQKPKVINLDNPDSTSSKKTGKSYDELFEKYGVNS